PATVLAQLDAVGRVAPRLVGLVVAPLAALACKRHSDSDVSASHSILTSGGRPVGGLRKKDLCAAARGARRIAAPARALPAAIGCPLDVTSAAGAPHRELAPAPDPRA